MKNKDITYCSITEHCPKKDSCVRAERPEWIAAYCMFCDERCQKEVWCEFYLPKDKSDD